MSVQQEDKNQINYPELSDIDNVNKKVNVNDLMSRMQETKKQERKNNIILSAAAISAVTVFGIILTL